MIRHVVMFKLVPFQSEEEKMRQMQAIKSALEGLKDKIDFLRFIQVGFNINPAETWDIILNTELDSMEDVAKYAAHPDHVAVFKEFIAPYKADRACVDYEVL